MNSISTVHPVSIHGFRFQPRFHLARPIANLFLIGYIALSLEEYPLDALGAEAGRQQEALQQCTELRSALDCGGTEAENFERPSGQLPGRAAAAELCLRTSPFQAMHNW